MKQIEIAWGRDLELDDEQRDQVARIVLDAFWPKLRSYRLTQDQVLGFLGDDLDLDRGLYALADDEIVGVLGVAETSGRFKHYAWRSLRRHFSPHMAFFAWLGHRFDRVPHGAWLIEPLAVAGECRGQGVGTALLQRLIGDAPGYGIGLLKLDVVDTNTGAEMLYKRMGFVRTRTRQTGAFTRQEGFTAIHYMQLNLEPREAT